MSPGTSLVSATVESLLWAWCPKLNARPSPGHQGTFGDHSARGSLSQRCWPCRGPECTACLLSEPRGAVPVAPACTPGALWTARTGPFRLVVGSGLSLSPQRGF